MAKKKPLKIPEEVLQFFREQGSKGGRIGGKSGGKRSLQTMTPAERTTRAKKAAAKSAEVRSAKAAKKVAARKKPATPKGE